MKCYIFFSSHQIIWIGDNFFFNVYYSLCHRPWLSGTSSKCFLHVQSGCNLYNYIHHVYFNIQICSGWLNSHLFTLYEIFYYELYCSPVHYKIPIFGQLLFVLRLFQMNLVALNKININLRHSFQEHSYKKINPHIISLLFVYNLTNLQIINKLHIKRKKNCSFKLSLCHFVYW